MPLTAKPIEHAAEGMPAPLLQIRDLTVAIGDRPAPASRVVDGVSLGVLPKQTLAVVGESGCGKSITALSVLGLLPPAARVESGSIMFGGRDVLTLSRREMLKVRGGQIAMIFQEPMTSLNPVSSIGEQIIEAVVLHQSVNHRQAREIAADALNEVGITDAAQRLKAYPHQFSGGMRQRVMIAMALACKPKVLLADEPTTALDVTIQAQILEILGALQRERGMGIMLITHDLGLVAKYADTVCVMYAGRVMEYGSVAVVLKKSLHPYTRALLACRPSMSEKKPRLRTVPEIIDNPAEFAPLANGATPWWPAWKNTPGTIVSLREIEHDHWVACVGGT